VLDAVTPDGAVRWRYPIGAECFATPVLAADGTIYIGDDGPYAPRPDGTFRRQYRDQTLFSSAPQLTGGDGTVYWRESRDFWAVTPAGETKWHLGIPAPDNSGIEPAPAIGSDGTLYVTLPDVFDAGNQELTAYSSPAVGRITLALAGLKKGSVREGGVVRLAAAVQPFVIGRSRHVVRVLELGGSARASERPASTPAAP
jgi:hypothetical protein